MSLIGYAQCFDPWEFYMGSITWKSQEEKKQNQPLLADIGCSTSETRHDEALRIKQMSAQVQQKDTNEEAVNE